MLPWWLGIIIYTVLIVISIIVIMKKCFYGDVDGLDVFFISFLTVVVMVFTSFFGMIYTEFNGNTLHIRDIEKNKQYIYSLEDNINIKGSYSSFFTIGNGYVGEDLYYYTLIGDTNGYILKKFKAEETYLVPEGDVQPYYIEKYKIEDTYYSRNIIFGYMFKKFSDIKSKETLIKTELHLPKNYIKQNYNIDLK